MASDSLIKTLYPVSFYISHQIHSHFQCDIFSIYNFVDCQRGSLVLSEYSQHSLRFFRVRLLSRRNIFWCKGTKRNILRCFPNFDKLKKNYSYKILLLRFLKLFSIKYLIFTFLWFIANFQKLKPFQVVVKYFNESFLSL